MAELQSKHSPQLEKLPVDAHRHLVEALIKAGSHVQDSDLREKFLTTVSSATDSLLIIYISPTHNCLFCFHTILGGRPPNKAGFLGGLH